jgi:hypothetical protein
VFLESPGGYAVFLEAMRKGGAPILPAERARGKFFDGVRDAVYAKH